MIESINFSNLIGSVYQIKFQNLTVAFILVLSKLSLTIFATRKHKNVGV